MEITKQSLEWICEQLEYLEGQAKDIEEEAYRCRLEVQRWIKDGKVTFKPTIVPGEKK